MNWCILIPLLVGLICALLGYLLGKLLSSGSDNTSDIDAWKSKYASLEADLVACKNARATLDADLAACRSKVDGLSAAGAMAMAATAGVAFDGEAAKAVFGTKIKQDDLKVVEGIGPKIEELFHNAGIKTWEALGAANYDTCKKILDDGGDRFKMHNPTTWPDQAKLAAEGKWAELKKWQDELDGGK
jgi:predicted flap endonuclease-1-like 5' DNA nuclease